MLIENKSLFSRMLKSLAAFLMWFAVLQSFADNLDTTGVALLRQTDPTLNGSGVRVAQVEGTESLTDQNVFQVLPQPIGKLTNLFTYYSTLGVGGGYPNMSGSGSSHATSVGGNFYGCAPPTYNGAATNVSHVDNYEAGYFYNTKIGFGATGVAIPAAVVNQSFNFTSDGQTMIENDYDNYIVAHKTLFLTGAGNGGSISTNPPGTCFNGIAVGVTDGNSAVGPTSDGRSKPDITSPGFGVTSFSTPYVSGAATILLQAAARGDGGASSSLATNVIAVKALLLNGAIKPVGWTNGPITPLDARYGSGVVNVFNSWNQLKGGQRSPIETTTVSPSGSPHPPGANASNEASLTGWDYNTAFSTSSSQDQVKHYYFNLTGSNSYTLTATLAWNRLQNQSMVNNLDLFLYNTADGNLILSSTSAVDNVEHLFLPTLTPGRYDLQVLKRGNGQVSTGETYALAFEFFSMKLNLALTNGNLTLSWTNVPTGFHLISAPNLNSSSAWAAVNAISVGLTNSQNTITVPLTSSNQFFRLQRP
jgi:hypothetical protein